MTTMNYLRVCQRLYMLAEYNGRLISLENKLRKLKEETNGTKPNKAREQIPTQGKLFENESKNNLARHDDGHAHVLLMVVIIMKKQMEK